MRERIRSLALDLLVQHGYRGVSFGDLAAALDTTRANIHYRYLNKQKLVESVLEEYVQDTSAKLDEVWTTPNVPLTRRIEAMTELSRKPYAKYNPRGKEGRPWSLIARMREDSEAWTPKSRATLQQFWRDLNERVTTAIEAAKENGEFVPWMPVDDVALQLVSIAKSSGPITQDAGSFDRLEQLYRSFTRIMMLAFGEERAVRLRAANRPDEASPANGNGRSGGHAAN